MLSIREEEPMYTSFRCVYSGLYYALNQKPFHRETIHYRKRESGGYLIKVHNQVMSQEDAHLFELRYFSTLLPSPTLNLTGFATFADYMHYISHNVVYDGYMPRFVHELQAQYKQVSFGLSAAIELLAFSHTTDYAAPFSLGDVSRYGYLMSQHENQPWVIPPTVVTAWIQISAREEDSIHLLPRIPHEFIWNIYSLSINRAMSTVLLDEVMWVAQRQQDTSAVKACEHLFFSEFEHADAVKVVDILQWNHHFSQKIRSLTASEYDVLRTYVQHGCAENCMCDEVYEDLMNLRRHRQLRTQAGIFSTSATLADSSARFTRFLEGEGGEPDVITRIEAMLNRIISTCTNVASDIRIAMYKDLYVFAISIYTLARYACGKTQLVDCLASLSANVVSMVKPSVFRELKKWLMSHFLLRRTQSGSIFELIARGVCVLGFALFAKLIPDSRTIDSFIRRLDSIPKAFRGLDSVWNYTEPLVTKLTSFIEEHLFGIATSVTDTKLIGEVVTWIDEIHTLSELQRRKSLVYDTNTVARVEQAYREGIRLIKETTGNRYPRENIEAIRSLMPAAKTLYEEAFRSGAGKERVRMEPIIIWLSGDTGVGKSTLMYYLVLEAMSAFGEIPKNWESNVYARVPETEYWDGFFDQEYIIYDDAFQLVDSQVKPNPELLEIIRLGNSFPYQLHMASLSEKANTFARPKLVVLNSNISTIGKAESIHYPEAVTRRIDIAADVDVKEEYRLYYTVGSERRYRVDPTKARKPDGSVNLDIYEFYRVDPFTRKVMHVLDWDAFAETVIMQLRDKFANYVKRTGSLEEHRDTLNQWIKHVNSRRVQMGWLPAFMRATPESTAIERARYLWTSFKTKADNFVRVTLPDWWPYISLALGAVAIYSSLTDMWSSMKQNSICSMMDLAYEKRSAHLRRICDEALACSLVGCSHCYKCENQEESELCLRWNVDCFCYAKVLEENVDFIDTFFGIDTASVLSEKVESLTSGDDLFELLSQNAKRPASREVKPLNPKRVIASKELKPKQPRHIVASREVKPLQPRRIIASQDTPYVPPQMRTQRSYLTNDKLSQDLATNTLWGNMVRVRAKRAGKIVRDFGSVLLVTGQCALMPYHYIVYMQHNPDLQISFERDGHVVCADVKAASVVKNFYRFPEKDMTMVSLPPQIGFGRNIVEHFIRRDQLYKVEGCPVKLLTLITSQTGSSRMVYSADSVSVVENVVAHGDNGETYLTRYAYEYNIATKFGDCGSPLLVSSNAIQGKIIGVHVAGVIQQMSGTACAIAYEEVKDALAHFTQIVQYGHVATNIDSDCHDALAEDGNFIVVDELESPVIKATKSQYAHSPVFERLLPTTRTWSHLRPYTRDGVVIDPERTQRKKWGHIINIMDDSEANIIYNGLKPLFLTVSSYEPPHVRLPLTLEEAVVGIPGDPYIGSINKRSSPGYPYIFTRKSNTGKVEYFGSGDFDLSTPEARGVLGDVQSLEASMLRNERPQIYWIDTLKDIPMERHKAEMGKTRIFAAGPMHYTILARRYLLPFLAHCTYQRIFNGVGVGINPTSYEWHRLYRHLKTVGSAAVAMDYSNFDGTTPRHGHVAFYEVICDWYAMHWEAICKAGRNVSCSGDEITLEQFQHVVRCIGVETYSHEHIMNWGTKSIVYQINNGMPSGCPTTAIQNSFVNIFILTWAWRSIWADNPTMRPVSKFLENVRFVTYGDDVQIVISDSAKEVYNFITIREKLLHLSITVTDESKTDCVVAYKSLEECSFLKRKFRFDEEYNICVAPLDVKVILDIPNWVKKGTKDPHLIVQDSLTIVLNELALHEASTFNEWKPRVQDLQYYVNRECPAASFFDISREDVLDRVRDGTVDRYYTP